MCSSGALRVRLFPVARINSKYYGLIRPHAWLFIRLTSQDRIRSHTFDGLPAQQCASVYQCLFITLVFIKDSDVREELEKQTGISSSLDMLKSKINKAVTRTITVFTVTTAQLHKTIIICSS